MRRARARARLLILIIRISVMKYLAVRLIRPPRDVPATELVRALHQRN